MKSCKSNGIDGLIIPDMVPEESGEIVKNAKKYGVSVVFLIAPNSTKERIKLAASLSSGFLYCVSLKGVTGHRSKLPDITAYIKNVRKITKLPLAVGFGVGNNAQAGHFLEAADGVIVGSAVIKKIRQNKGSKDLVNKVTRFVSSLKKGY